MYKIIDGHSHFIPREIAENTAFFRVNWSDIDKQLEVMDLYNIEKSLLLYPTSDAHLNMNGSAAVCSLYNSRISEVVSAYSNRFIGAAILPVDNPSALKIELKRVENLEFKVLSLASSYNRLYLDDESFYPIYEYAQANNIIIYVHPQIIDPIGEDRVIDPLLTPVVEYVFDLTVCVGKLMMSNTFDRFPGLKFVFAHFGGVLPFLKERFDNTYLMLRKRNFVKDLGKKPSDFFKNLYFDTTGSGSVSQLLCALELVDSNNIIFGSDFPANQEIGKSIKIISESSLSDEEKRKIFRNEIFEEL